MFAMVHGKFGPVELVDIRRGQGEESCVWVRHAGATLSMSPAEAAALGAALSEAARRADEVAEGDSLEIPLAPAAPEASEPAEDADVSC
jgi:hypothetical protein